MNRDNHAGKIDMYSWVGGFFDGEGHLSLRKTYCSSRHTWIYQPLIVIVNTDKESLILIKEWLEKNGCKTNLNIRSQHLKNPTKWRPTWTLSLYGIKRVKIFLDLLGNYVITKKNQVILVKEFITYRLSGNQRKTYTDFEPMMVEKIKALHHSKSPETTR
jgi:hypothetical protein